jgi:Histone H1-like nucleoprotein HC2
VQAIYQHVAAEQEHHEDRDLRFEGDDDTVPVQPVAALTSRQAAKAAAQENEAFEDLVPVKDEDEAPVAKPARKAAAKKVAAKKVAAEKDTAKKAPAKKAAAQKAVTEKAAPAKKAAAKKAAAKKAPAKKAPAKASKKPAKPEAEEAEQAYLPDPTDPRFR